MSVSPSTSVSLKKKRQGEQPRSKRRCVREGAVRVLLISAEVHRTLGIVACLCLFITGDCCIANVDLVGYILSQTLYGTQINNNIVNIIFIQN